MGLIQALTDPNIRKHLLRDEGEVIVDEVRKHWVVYTMPALEVLVASMLLVASPFVSIDLAWFPFALAMLVLDEMRKSVAPAQVRAVSRLHG